MSATDWQMLRGCPETFQELFVETLAQVARLEREKSAYRVTADAWKERALAAEHALAGVGPIPDHVVFARDEAKRTAKKARAK